MKLIFEEIASINLGDGFSFRNIQIKELTHSHMRYPGVDVSMIGYFGKTRFNVTIDIGFGDIVDPVQYAFSLMSYSKGNLFERSIDLSCYPKEFIFAEKLETIVYRGSFNSRMKDFHDLYSMISSPSFTSFQNLKSIISMVFKHRKTQLVLIEFTEQELDQMQKFWGEYLRNLRLKHRSELPENIIDVISNINKFLFVEEQHV